MLHCVWRDSCRKWNEFCRCKKKKKRRKSGSTPAAFKLTPKIITASTLHERGSLLFPRFSNRVALTLCPSVYILPAWRSHWHRRHVLHHLQCKAHDANIWPDNLSWSWTPAQCNTVQLTTLMKTPPKKLCLGTQQHRCSCIFCAINTKNNQFLHSIDSATLHFW